VQTRQHSVKEQRYRPRARCCCASLMASMFSTNGKVSWLG
jgi:hypothetical protein